MTTVTKIKETLFDRALAALKVFKQLQDLTALLDADKAFFRDAAQGETTTIEVPGVGKVQVKKPSEGGISTSTILNLKKWEELDQAKKHELIKLGLVEVKTTSRAPSLAAVVFTLNV